MTPRTGSGTRTTDLGPRPEAATGGGPSGTRGAGRLVSSHGRLPRLRSLAKSLLKHGVLIVVGLVMLYPVLWMVSSSFKPNALIFRDPALIPRSIDLSSYRLGWNALQSPFTRYLLNSVIVVAGAVLGNLVSCSLAAYAFARLKFRARAVLRDHAYVDHAAHPRDHRPTVHSVLPSRLD